MDLSVIGMAFGLLLLLVLCWFGFHFWANPPLKDPDALARVTGNCGDTMELALRFQGERVERVRHWTDGCSVSNQCVEAAAMLAQGKDIEALRKINMMSIMELTGQLPDSHLHCAQLAETTLQRAVAEYVRRQGTESCHGGAACG